MRLNFLSVFMLMTLGMQSSAVATCGGGMEASSAGVYIGQGDCEYEEDTIVVTHRGETETSRFSFAQECKWDERSVTPERLGYVPYATYRRGFACRTGGKSPLAGTRYSIAFDWMRKDGCGKVPHVAYLCRSGCDKRAPREFNILPSDCDY